MQGHLRSVAHEITTAHNKAVSVARLKGTAVIRRALLQQRRLSIVVRVQVRQCRAVHVAVAYLVQLASLRVAYPRTLGTRCRIEEVRNQEYNSFLGQRIIGYLHPGGDARSSLRGLAEFVKQGTNEAAA